MWQRFRMSVPVIYRRRRSDIGSSASGGLQGHNLAISGLQWLLNFAVVSKPAGSAILLLLPLIYEALQPQHH